jgi:anti-anti-sigma factor
MASSDRILKDGVLRVRLEPNGKELVVRVSGELDIASAKTFADELRQASDSDASAVILDLSEVSFIDATGIRALVFAAARSRSNGDRLRMRRGSASVVRALAVSGLEQTLPLIG